MPRYSLLDLPCEVRLMVYHAYFTVSGGYVPNHDLRKLTASNGDPIDLGLMYTCKMIAHEVRGLPLNLNTITFSTAFSDYFNLLAKLLDEFREHAVRLQNIHIERLQPLVNENVYNKVVQRFPSSEGHLDILQPSHQPSIPWNKLGGNLVAYTLQQIISHHDASVVNGIAYYSPSETEDEEDGDPILEGRSSEEHDTDPNEDNPFALTSEAIDRLAQLFLDLPEWSLPTKAQVNRMAEFLPDDMYLGQVGYRKRRFSAAAVAIHFLHNTPNDTRQQMRHILLNEDDDGCVFPERHGPGLIPFCQENPCLRIERRVNVWHTIFAGTHTRRSLTIRSALETSQDKPISRITCWFMGALSLASQGMPPESMITFFDGDPAPELCSEMFQTALHRDVAWISAAMRSFPDRIYSMMSYVGNSEVDHCEELVLGLKCLTDGSGIFQCNFDPGQVWDVDTICREISHLSYDDWYSDIWKRRSRYQYHLSPKWEEMIGLKYFTEDEGVQSVKRAVENGFPQPMVELMDVML